jgi:hypothetical protein
MYTKRITFSREFLSGNLAGLIVRLTINTTADAAHAMSQQLRAFSRREPGMDASGNLYWNYNVGCEDIAAVAAEVR